MIELTQEEKQFILSVIATITVNILQKDAGEVVKIAQSIQAKLTENDKVEAGKT